MKSIALALIFIVILFIEALFLHWTIMMIGLSMGAFIIFSVFFVIDLGIMDSFKEKLHDNSEEFEKFYTKVTNEVDDDNEQNFGCRKCCFYSKMKSKCRIPESFDEHGKCIDKGYHWEKKNEK